MSAPKNDWAGTIRAARGKLSQAQAAQKIAPALSVRTVQEWESGRSSPPAWVQWLVLLRLSANCNRSAFRGGV